MRRLLSDRLARRLAPVSLLLAALCFLLPFATVSRDTDRVKPAIDDAIRSAADATHRPLTTERIDACLDALRGTRVASYSGLSLVTGSDPSVNSPAPPECPGSLAAVAAVSARQENIGGQTLAVGALACILVALLLGSVPSRPRGLVVALLAGIAMVLLILDQNRLPTLIGDLAPQGGLSPLAVIIRRIPGFVDVGSGYGYWLALVILLLTALHNSAATIVTGSAPRPRPAPARSASTPDQP